ncbi:hypothetical protein ACT8ZS_06410 [Paenibacillus sp. M.A.Huq-84]
MLSLGCIVALGFTIPPWRNTISNLDKSDVCEEHSGYFDRFFRKYEFVYNERFDCCYLCPAHTVLSYELTNRDGHRCIGPIQGLTEIAPAYRGL